MIVENLDTWEDFDDRVQELQSDRLILKKSSTMGVSNLLFRGQGHHSWPLHTTLERKLGRSCPFSEYYRLIRKVLPEIDTFTGSNWQLEGYPEIDKWASDYDSIWKPPLGYEYLVYLRHHGFPSPLLDWSHSPFVAAFFAFMAQCSDRVAVYAYMEYAGQPKASSSNAPQIRTLGRYVRSHSRHFLQQSEYSIAAEFREGQLWYASHEDVFSSASDSQDRLWKITIPANERLKALMKLDAYNLNAYSLLQTDESLLSTIAVREMEFAENV